MTRLQSIYKRSWSTFRQLNKEWLILYVTTVLAALFIALPFNAFLKNKTGHSIAIGYDLGKFDMTFIGDLINQHGQGIWVVFNQLKYVLFVYLILTIFLNGGLLGSIKRIKSDLSTSFFNDCGYFFWRFLKLTLLFICLYVTVIVLAVISFRLLMGGWSPFGWQSDGQLIWSFRAVACMAGFLLFIALMLHDYAKMILVSGDYRSQFLVIRKAISHVGGDLWLSLAMYTLHMLLFVALYAVYKWVQVWIPISGLAFVGLLFVWSQIFIWLRIGIKVWNLTTIHQKYESD